MALGQVPIMNYSQYPLKGIPEAHAHDVLCGRGGGTNNHIGNSHWRMLVAANKQLYITLPKRQKMLLSRSIVNAVRSQNPPGRFLQKEGKTKLWFDVGDQRAQEKTSQALREGAPDIRKKVAAAKPAATTTKSTATPAVPVLGNSKTGAEIDGGHSSQIPVNSPAASPVVRQQKSATSAVLPQTTGTGGRMIPPQEPQHYDLQPQQQQHQQQQMNSMYADHDGAGHNCAGHMTLNERGVMIQTAMMSGDRRLNGQHQLQMNSNNNNYRQSQDAYRFQQHQHQDHLQQQMHRQQEYQQQQQYQYQQQQNNNVNYQQQQYQQAQQQQYINNNNNPVPFENFDASPPEELDRDGLSFGSLHMTDTEMHMLQKGSAHSPRKYPQSPHQQQNRRASNNGYNGGRSALPPAPMGGVLEPTGISIGDVSMHSVGTNFQMKLEDNGTSFGTMMSYNTLNSSSNDNNPDMVDGGLMDAVGCSFGSLSLDKNNRDMLFKTLEIAGGGLEVPPMFRSETKSSANLLDCSDTDSESSRDKQELTKQKSQAWEMMKTQLEKQTSKGASVDSQDLMPPPLGVLQQNSNIDSNKNRNTASAAATFDNLEINLPPTSMEANFSTLSAWSATDDFDDSPSAVKRDNAECTSGNDDDVVAAPPPQLTKTDSF